ncbi:hypothetical protein IC799_01085 [Acinetobacter seifertii]|uniref:phosphorylase family protein n=1 Tax=Acinetobacter seifertii TaxID=1530123 RepID=UPI00168B8B5A|nr:hypothetical protein [Acinetobacter seifertii]QNW91636.1 hypothetical protein IC799_01085 [Acinetobacter seifertii]
MKILIVDDESNKIIKIKSEIETSFPDVLVEYCLTINDAKKYLNNNKDVDLMILDLNMRLSFDTEPDLKYTLQFINDIVKIDKYNLPKHIVGLTAFEDCELKARSEFQKKLWTILNYSEVNNEWAESIRHIVKYIVENKTDLKKIDMCIVTALRSPEAEAIRKYVKWEWTGLKPIDSSTFCYEGKFVDKNGFSRNVLLCSPPEMGMVHTAILTTKLLHLFNPQVIAMTGICAGYREKSSLGDTIIAKSAWNYNDGKYILQDNEPVFMPSVLQSNLKTNINSLFDCMMDEYKDKWHSINEEYSDESVINTNLTLDKAVIATGNWVLSDSVTIDKILYVNRKVKAVEMEIDAFYAACQQYPKQLDFFAVKSICDFADSEKNDEFQSYSSFTSAKCLQKFIEEFYDFN